MGPYPFTYIPCMAALALHWQELGSCNRAHMACEAENVYHLALRRALAQCPAMTHASVLSMGISSWPHLLNPTRVHGLSLRSYLKTNIRSVGESQSFREGQRQGAHNATQRTVDSIRNKHL